MARLAIADKLLLAAQALEDSGRCPFTSEDLVVQAWRLFPESFGLAGHLDVSGKPLYPDSNRVYAEVMGSKPIRKKGLFEKTGKKMYRLSEVGRNLARSFSSAPEDTAPGKVAISREVKVALRRLMESRAAAKAREGRHSDITFFDACGFWGIGARSKAKDLWIRFAGIDAVLKSAREALGDAQSGATRHGGVPYTIADLDAIDNVHETLQDSFSDELNHIKRRTHDSKR